MVQVLPYVPGFGEKLADAIGKSAGDFTKSYVEQFQKQKDQQILQGLGDPNRSYLDKFSSLGGLSPDLRRDFTNAAASILQPEAQAAADIKGAERFGLGPGNAGNIPSAQFTSAHQQPDLNEGQNLPNQPLSAPASDDEQARRRKIREEANQKLAFKGNKNPYLAGQAAIGEQTLKDLDKQEAIERENQQIKRKEEIEFHKESSKYDDEINEQTKVAKKQIDAIDSIEESVNSGNITQSSAANIFKGFGKIGDKVSEWLKNPDQAKFEAAIPQLLEGWKDVFGVRLTDADLRILQDKLPSLGKSPEANKAVVGVLRKYADQTLLRSKIASEIKEKNGGLRPLGYANLIEKRYDEMIAPVQVISPKTGKVISIPAYKLSDAIQAGAKLANE